MIKRSFVLITILVASVAPAWDIRDEGYTCTTAGMTLAELQSAGITLVSHVPCTKGWMDEAAKYGIRGMPYISLYKVYDLTAPRADAKHPFWGAVAMNDHPEWVYIGPDGRRARPFNNPFYPKCNWQSCTNTAGIADAYCRGAAGVIKAGAGGVFIDNVLPARICYGPKFGIHQHLYPEHDNIHSFKIALGRVRDTVKGFGADRVVMLNVGTPWHRWQGFGDCIMLESFIYNVAVRPGPGGWVGNKRVRVKQWPQILKWIEDAASYVDGSGCIVTLEYLPNDPDAAFYTYACAKLGNFLWSGTMHVRRDIVRTLHRCRLQRASGPLREKDGVYFRHYPNGLAAVNTTDHEAAVTVPAPAKCSQLADVRDARLLPVNAGQVRLRVPPQSGRVYVAPERLAGGHLREAIVALDTAAAAGPPDTALQGAVEAARSARQAAAGAGISDATSPLADVCRKLAACEKAESPQAVGRALAPGPKLSRVDARKRVGACAENDALKCEILKDKVVMTTGDVDWELGGAKRPVQANGVGADCGVSMGDLHSVHGWLGPGAIESVGTLTDTTERKIVELTMTICGTKSKSTIPGVAFILTAEARRGEKGLRLRSAVRNTGGKAMPCYFIWHSHGAGTWCSFPGQPSTRGDRYVQFRQSDWTYMHVAEAGGRGLLLVTDLPQSYSPYGWHVYSEPRSGPLAPGEERAIAFDIYVVEGSWQDSPTALGAFRRAQFYASQAYALAAGIEVALRTDEQVTAGAEAQAALTRVTGEAPLIESASLLDEKGGCVEGPEAKVERGTVTFTPPISLRKNQFAQLVVRYTAAAGSRKPVPLAHAVDVRPRPSLSLRPASPPHAWDGRLGEARLVVENHLQEPVACRLTVDAPDGYDPGKPPMLRVNGRQAKEVSIAVTSAKASAPPRTAKAILTLDPRGRAGELELPLRFATRITCPRLPSAPVIDGKTNEETWRHAATTTPFVLIRGGGTPKEPTAAMVGYDQRYLYVALRCTESNMDGLVADTAPNPGVSNRAVHSDDSIEVFLSPTRDRAYVQLAANSRGAQKMSKPIKWDVAAVAGDNVWTVEMRIDLASLARAPKAGDRWTVNFCRMQQRLKEASAWSPTDRSFHQPERFGILVFGE